MATDTTGPVRAAGRTGGSVAGADDTTVVERLRVRMPDARTGWGLIVMISALAFLLRLWDLQVPHSFVFDETYYAKDAWSLMHHGYERSWAEGANEAILAGDIHQMEPTADFVVHPPLGKVLIGLGELAFGFTPFGWRIMAVLFGSLMVGATMVLARRLSRSTVVAGIAGLLLAVDGLHFTMSRMALLDIFQATFLVAAVAALATDRDWMRERLARYLEGRGIPRLGADLGPFLPWRPWRILAGVLFGLSIAVKWNSLYALAAFSLLSLSWDIGARRLAGARHPGLRALLPDGAIAFAQLVVVAIPAYFVTWVGWLATPGGWSRQWAAEHPDTWLARLLPDGLASLASYHREIYGFHTGDYINEATHPYASDPWGWLLLTRPVGLDAVNDIPAGTDGCPEGTETCLRVITSLGTPALWWVAALALVAAIIWWIGKRDWRFAVPVVGTLAMWLPWFQYADRPLFYFYAINMIPFLVVGLALFLGKILGPADGGRRRMIGACIVGVYLALVVLNFAYFYPIYTDGLLLHGQWMARMWFETWI